MEENNNDRDFFDIDTNEAVDILTATFEKHGLKLNVPSLLSENRKIYDGRKRVKKRHAPVLRHTKRGRLYFYNGWDLQDYIDAMIQYHDKPLELPHRRITANSLAECIDEMGGESEVWQIKLKNGAILHIGIESDDKERVAVSTPDGKLYYLDVDNSEKTGGE